MGPKIHPSPWDNFKVQEELESAIARKGSLWSWVALIFVTTAVGAGLALAVLFWWVYNSDPYKGREYRQRHLPTLTAEQTERLLYGTAAGGGAIGLLTGIGLWAYAMRPGANKRD